MNTEQLIGTLVRDTLPVTRPSAPINSFVKWSAVGSLYLAAGIFMIGTRDDLATMWHETGFLIHTIIVLALTVLTAMAAFRTSIPERGQDLLVISSTIALVAWLAWLLGAALTASEPHTGLGVKCLRNILALSIPLGMLAYYMMNRGAPLRTGTAGWLAALSATAAADLATRFICRNDHGLHALIWHFIPVVTLGCTGVLLGRVVFRWEGATK